MTSAFFFLVQRGVSLLGVLGIVGLSGCSSYEGEFDCPKGEGLPCASLSEVNRQIDVGLLGREEGSVAEVKGMSGPACRGERCVPEQGDVLQFYYPPQFLASGEIIPGRWTRRVGS